MEKPVQPIHPQRVPREGGYLLLIGYGLYESFTNGTKELPAKLGMAAIALGFLSLVVLLLRERIQTYKSDPYKEIER